MHKRYELVTEKRRLSGTDYFEFFPGPDDGRHWHEESAYLREEGFDPLLSLVYEVYPQFDGYGYQALNRSEVLRFCEILLQRAELVSKVRSHAALGDLLMLSRPGWRMRPREFFADRREIGELMLNLQTWLRCVVQTEDTVMFYGL